jgi:hypothetical protein
VTEDRFLQLLLSQFSLRRRQEPGGESFELCVRFDENTPAICNAQAKAHLRSILPAEKRMRYQQRLDDFLLNSRGGNEYSFNDPAFFFRYASGGTLPIISPTSTLKDFFWPLFGGAGEVSGEVSMVFVSWPQK